MSKLLVFVGESGSGKSTLIGELARRYPNLFARVITCTSRPIRPGEIDGADYYFLHQEDFETSSDLVLVNKTSEGFYYGTKISSILSSDTPYLLLALRLVGIQKLVDLGIENMTIVRISASEEVRVGRMRLRGDNEEVISSRLQSDVDIDTHVDLRNIPIIDLDALDSIDVNMDVVLKRVGG